ncbi:LysR family transcriptional regulator [Acidisoma sp. L85]|uniref:LysR family transcriptional regulator n=1 Tax=Acidisoma sp. L85 TaxID=1641850 RepID=UPI00131E00ED|nr:LysR family transcriptional regulator [Acidisoma sp. L85]
MELYQIRYFLALTRTLNFSSAAKQCNVSQPALTKAVQRLEQELGGELIHRERHLTQLSDLGKAVLPMLEQTIDAANAIASQAREYWSKSNGKLRVGLISSVSAFVMAELFSELARSVPGLQIDLIEDKNEGLITALMEGDIHAALADQTSELPLRIDHWVLFEERYVVVTSPSHAFAGLTEIPVDRLRDATWLQCDTRQISGRFENTHLADQTTWRIGHRAQQESHLQHLAAIGLGAFLAPEHAPLLPSLVSRPIKDDPLRRQVELLAVAGRRHSPILDAFIKIARRHDWQRTLGEAYRDPGVRPSWQPTPFLNPHYGASTADGADCENFRAGFARHDS